MSKARYTPDPGELAPTRLSLLERLRDMDDRASWQEFFDTYWKLIYLAASLGIVLGLTYTVVASGHDNWPRGKGSTTYGIVLSCVSS